MPSIRVCYIYQSRATRAQKVAKISAPRSYRQIYSTDRTAKERSISSIVKILRRYESSGERWEAFTTGGAVSTFHCGSGMKSERCCPAIRSQPYNIHRTLTRWIAKRNIGRSRLRYRTRSGSPWLLNRVLDWNSSMSYDVLIRIHTPCSTYIYGLQLMAGCSNSNMCNTDT